MNRMHLAIFLASLLATSAAAQTQTGAQAGTQAGAQTNVGSGGAQASASATTSASAQNNGTSATIADGTEINATLNAPVDAKKAKPGDQVMAHTTEAVKAQGKTVVPRGAKLVGHVTKASARGRGDAESVLGIVFDKAILKNGEEIALNGSIQALASAETAASAAGADLDSTADVGAAGSGRVMSGGRGTVASTAGGAIGTVANTAGSATSTAGGAVDRTTRAATGVGGAAGGAVGGVTANGQFASNSRGVFGLNGLNLNATGSNSTEGSVITSGGKNVHLDSGTRMLIVAGAGAQTGQDNAPAPNKNPKPPKPPAHSDGSGTNHQ